MRIKLVIPRPGKYTLKEFISALNLDRIPELDLFVQNLFYYATRFDIEVVVSGPLYPNRRGVELGVVDDVIKHGIYYNFPKEENYDISTGVLDASIKEIDIIRLLQDTGLDKVYKTLALDAVLIHLVDEEDRLPIPCIPL